MARWLYSAVWYLALPLVLRRLRKRAQKAPAYGERVGERFGKVPVRDDKPLWIHSVSVGETVAIAPLVKLLLKRQPELPILMTTMTPTGAERVRDLFGDQVQHLYCPYDLPHALSRFMQRINPRALIVVETELWPNVVAACRSRNVPVLLANARLSARSAKGYAKFSALTRPMLKSLSRVAAQNQTDGNRFVELGLPPEKLVVTGSVKFDISVPESAKKEAAGLRKQWGIERPVIVAGSTHEGEESMLLDLYARLLDKIPDLLMVLVPRHPERFDGVNTLTSKRGFKVTRRSGGDPNAETQIYVGDTMGDLLMLYASADLAFVGGSLVERGGHNPLEPAALAKPVIMGEYVFNFAVICEALKEAGGLVLVGSLDELEQHSLSVLKDPQRAAQLGTAAAAFVKENQGALERLYQQVESICLGAPK
ncbi:lipid IV(A) 3-deoxy-D-manno-octulosonic acid transferase [Pontibacterium granulatum]|uniref:lipid IV(A) 3-deoxy-D-manno-octulosonic acid transferase n=1 Tax=Pontibacterium granulatum TaxID=2036029 RepID=UPI00249C95D4|nr:lipid IV(A) 3-deoxy-D-manno-octulosonic acid transferase [Pontibacterium granulatum]MDI3324632.1 lipid IV(A) 3-deoxy-D-manno-octulosonic acid transferase [Pontibacterium granulatum]